MCGTFRQGDVLLVSPTTLGAVRPGDIVAFQQRQPNGDSGLIVHRVRALSAMGLITQGDNNSQPDEEVICPERVIGRVCFVHRNGKMYQVRGGWTGLLWASTLQWWRRVVPLARWPYRLLRSSGIVRHLWRPCVSQVHLTTEEGALVKHLHGGRTVACWWPDQKRFWCRKPYDLIIEPPN